MGHDRVLNAKHRLRPAAFLPLLILMSSCATLPDRDLPITDSRFTSIIFEENCDATVIKPDQSCAILSQTNDVKLIPNIPNRSCYTWFIRFDGFTDKDFLTERLVFPEPIDGQPADDGPGTVSTIAPDKKSMTVRHPIEAGHEYLGNSWCVAEDEPIGPYAIEIEYRDKLIKRFDFTVVPPDAMTSKIQDGTT